MVKLIHVTPQAGFKLHLEYDDGTIGDVEVSDLIGKGVFKAFTIRRIFMLSMDRLKWSLA